MKKILSIVILTLALFFGAVSLSVEAAVNRVQAMHILVPTEAQAVEIRKEIVAGQTQNDVFNNFRNAAKKYSKCPSGADGGMLGYFCRGDMVRPFEEAAFNLPNGEVSQPVKTQFGWHLIYVISKR